MRRALRIIKRLIAITKCSYRIAKRLSIVCLVLALLHVVYLGVGMGEKYLQEQAAYAKSIVIDAAARAGGYEKPETGQSELNMFDLAEREALRRKVNPAYVRALMKTESANNPNARSKAGALGLMQVMPANAYTRCQLKHPNQLLQEEEGIICGTRMIAEELSTYGGDPIRANNAYNGGPACVEKCRVYAHDKDPTKKGVICDYPCKESFDHNKRVMAHMVADVRG